MSTVDKKVVSQLIEQELALKTYLDALLSEVGAQVECEVTPDAASQVVTSSTDIDVKPSSTDFPEWSRGEFECLHFKVAGGLMLSVPLACLNGIVPWPEKLTAVPGYAEWFLGLLASRGRQIKIVDIAKFVIPENHQIRNKLMSGERSLKHIVLVDDCKFGFACDELNGIIRLTQQQVRWRHDKSTRPWLAGTVVEQMCALLDVERFVAMLKEGVPQDDISDED